jgi:hypothetical protein
MDTTPAGRKNGKTNTSEIGHRRVPGGRKVKERQAREGESKKPKRSLKGVEGGRLKQKEKEKGKERAGKGLDRLLADRAYWE